MQVELAVKPNLNIAVRSNVRFSVLNQITEGFTFRLIQLTVTCKILLFGDFFLGDAQKL